MRNQKTLATLQTLFQDLDKGIVRGEQHEYILAKVQKKYGDEAMRAVAYLYCNGLEG